MVKPAVTTIVTAFNAERYLPRCIESILSQTYHDVRVVVVDDHSTDRTAEVAAAYGNRVTVITLPANRGPAVGRTVGLMTAETEYVAFLDADDYWQLTFVETTVRFMEGHPDLVAASTSNCKEDSNGREYYRPTLDEQDKAYYGLDGAMCLNFYEFWAKYNAVLTGTVMMRTKAAHQTGGQREDLRLTEDLEFWGYLATFGPWGFIPQPLFVTDLRVLTPRERLRKFERRYAFFCDLTLESWSSRITPRLKDDASMRAFERFVGHIATEIALANAYTFRLVRSYRLARQWRSCLDRGLGSVLGYGSRGGPLLWPFVCMALRAREVVKSYLWPIRAWVARHSI
jgi:glycosyltransferase involved in cell wall biosynthesis